MESGSGEAGKKEFDKAGDTRPLWDAETSHGFRTHSLAQPPYLGRVHVAGQEGAAHAGVQPHKVLVTADVHRRQHPADGAKDVAAEIHAQQLDILGKVFGQQRKYLVVKVWLQSYYVVRSIVFSEEMGRAEAGMRSPRFEPSGAKSMAAGARKKGSCQRRGRHVSARSMQKEGNPARRSSKVPSNPAAPAFPGRAAEPPANSHHTNPTYDAPNAMINKVLQIHQILWIFKTGDIHDQRGGPTKPKMV